MIMLKYRVKLNLDFTDSKSGHSGGTVYYQDQCQANQRVELNHFPLKCVLELNVALRGFNSIICRLQRRNKYKTAR